MLVQVLPLYRCGMSDLDRDVLDPLEAGDLPRSFIVINRSKFTLTVYKRPTHTAKEYEQVWQTRAVAVGAPGHTTPGGPHIVVSKKVHPSWYMPNADWVPEEDRGKVISPNDERNPIKGAWLGFYEDPSGNVGIHGTDALYSLRSRASHGCVRVSPEDALSLYAIIAVGTPVFVR